MAMMFPFRYKLSLIISALAVLILILAFVAIDDEIEKEFRLVIEQRLVQAQRVVDQQMQERFERLFSQAVSVSDSKLIQDVITDKSISRATCDDIVSDEILPTLIQTDYLLVTNGDGGLLADSSDKDLVWQQIKNQAAFNDGLSGPVHRSHC